MTSTNVEIYCFSHPLEVVEAHLIRVRFKRTPVGGRYICLGCFEGSWTLPSENENRKLRWMPPTKNRTPSLLIFFSPKKKIRVIPCRRAEFLLCLAVAPLNITLESAIADLVSFKSMSQDCGRRKKIKKEENEENEKKELKKKNNCRTA